MNMEKARLEIKKAKKGYAVAPYNFIPLNNTVVPAESAPIFTVVGGMDG